MFGEDITHFCAAPTVLTMRGNVVMNRYFADEEATAEAFSSGWFHSGDLAVRHADGSVEFGPLPKTSTGKVQKFLLRDREWHGREKRIN